MSKFFKYFKDTLKFPLLRDSSALTSIAAGIAKSLDMQLDNIAWVRDQFVACKCDPDHLRHFAYSRGIKRYPFETDDQYKERVHLAYVFYSQSGKDIGLKRIFKLYGLDVVLQSLRAEDPGRWAEFRMVFNDIKGDIMTRTSNYVEIANDTKPAASKLAGIKYTMSSLGDVGVVSAITRKQKIVVMPDQLKEIRYSSDSKVAQHMSIKFKTIVNPEIITKISYSPATRAVSMINTKYRCIVGG